MHKHEKYLKLQALTEKKIELLKELQTREEQLPFKYILKKLPVEKFWVAAGILMDQEKNEAIMVDKLTKINSHINLTGKNQLTICQIK